MTVFKLKFLNAGRNASWLFVFVLMDCQRQRNGCAERPAIQKGLKRQLAALSLAMISFRTLCTTHKFKDKITTLENTGIAELTAQALALLALPPQPPHETCPAPQQPLGALPLSGSLLILAMHSLGSSIIHQAFSFQTKRQCYQEDLLLHDQFLFPY